jgi:flagellar protein FlaJ
MKKESKLPKQKLVGQKKKSAFSAITKTPKRKTGFLSGIAGLAIILATFIASNYTGNTTIRDIGAIGGIITIVVPLAMLDLKLARRRESIDRNLPIFLLALSSSVQSGQTLLRAIAEVADRNMGALTPELRNLRANISWGMPVEDAFANFIQRAGTRMARRVMVLLQLTMQIGGDIADTLEVIQRHVTEMSNLEKERKSELQPYIFTIYISFAVFLAITAILVSQFFAELENVQESLKETVKKSGVGTGGLSMFNTLININVNSIKQIMFHMAIVEAVIGGLAAGKIGEASFVAGVKHIVVMIVISVIAFALIGGL